MGLVRKYGEPATGAKFNRFLVVDFHGSSGDIRSIKYWKPQGVGGLLSRMCIGKQGAGNTELENVNQPGVHQAPPAEGGFLPFTKAVSRSFNILDFKQKKNKTTPVDVVRWVLQL